MTMDFMFKVKFCVWSIFELEYNKHVESTKNKCDITATCVNVYIFIAKDQTFKSLAHAY